MIKKIAGFWSKTLSRRLVIAVVLTLIPLVFVCANLIAKQNEEITFSTTELEGSKLSEIALQLHAEAIDKMIKVSNASRISHSNNDTLVKLNDYKKSHTLSPEILSKITAIEIAARELEYNSNNYEAAVGLKIATKDLIDAIGEEYLLFLDPKIDSYYLMLFSINQSINLIDALGDYSIAKSSIIFDEIEEHNLKMLEGFLRGESEEFAEIGNKAIRFSYNLGEKSDRIEDVHKINTQIEALFSAKTEDTLKYYSDARQSLLNLNLLAHQAMAKTIDDRVQKLITNQIIIYGLAFILFLLAFLIIFLDLKIGMIRPLKKLTKEMKDVADGDYSIVFDDNNRKDEIGDMIRAAIVLKENSVARIEAENANKAKSEFLAIISHEIRTPMNGVLGMAQALAATELDKNQKEMISVIQDSGNTLVSLLNDILDMAKIESGRIEVENIRMSPCAILRGAYQLFKQKAHEKGLELLLDIDEPSQGWYIGDPNRVRQIVFNLISNAIKFTEYGSVTLGISITESNALRFYVKDTGIGIPEERKNRLFEKFTQMDSSHTRKYGGTGLGLAICKGLIETMGGEIWAESEANVGTTFIFTLPAQIAEEPKEIPCDKCHDCMNKNCIESQIGKSIDDYSAQNTDFEEDNEVKVLVVDDNETNRLVLKTLLGQIGMEVDYAENGQIAFEAWTQRLYDVVLMDVQMPVMDGIETTRKIREWEDTYNRDHTPIVMLTANVNSEQVAQYLEAGADSHAAKPIEINPLLDAMTLAMDKAQEYNASKLNGSDTAKVA